MIKIAILGFLLLASVFSYSYVQIEDDEVYQWGLYKPQLIHAVTQSTNTPLVVSQAYFHNHFPNATLRYEFPKRKSDKIIYNYRVNTGSGYAIQEVNDPFLGGLEMVQNFIRMNPTDWIDTTRNITSKSKSLKSRNIEIGFIYAIAFENFEQASQTNNTSSAEGRSLLIDRINEHNITIISSCRNHKIMITGKNLAENISFRGIASNERDNWDVERLLNQIEYRFDNQIETNSTIIFVKTATKLNVGAEIQVFYTPSVKRGYLYVDDKYITEALDPWVQTMFNYIFNVETQNSTEKFKPMLFKSWDQFMISRQLSQAVQTPKAQLEKRTINNNEMTCATHSFYNLLGGVQYSYGDLLCNQEDETCEEYLPLFTTTPSRLGFPRPFLWDDGFHQMLTCQWDLAFCKQQIQKWFNTISSEGWIPREQPRGPEVRSYIPWLHEDNRDGNPPSFLFNLLYIQKQEDQEGYIQNLIPKIESWFGWWMNIQRVQQDSNSTSDLLLFKWWGPDETYNLGSGMDDWPRVENFDGQLYASKYNIDASAWAYFFSESLAVLTKNSTYSETAQKIKNSINEVLLNKEDSIYYDMLFNTTTNEFGQNITKYHLATHLGYPNFIPLMLGLVNDTKVLEKQIYAMMNQETLWTPYGIRSLSLKDEYFGQGSNYWRGPIWINMQYMILRSMKLYYWDQSDIVQEFYESLRQNVINTVCGEFETRGYFFEHFNQKLDGKGAGNHPFNGWTSLITLIITESYI